MSGNSAAQPKTALVLCLAFLAWAAVAAWAGAAAQGLGGFDVRGETARAQRELTAAENVLRDTRDARAKIESATADRLARIAERRARANALADAAQRRDALRALDAEEKRARDDVAKARATETIAEQNAETAALALARARAGGKDSPKGPPEPIVAPIAKPAPAPPPPPTPEPAAAPAKPAAPPAQLDALIGARMDVEAAEAAFARARAQREEAERATGDEIRELTRLLAETVELKKRAEGPRAAEAAEFEASLKARIQEASAKLAPPQSREAEAKAALDAARAREAKARADIEARIPAKTN